jgi:hypothetical protein
MLLFASVAIPRPVTSSVAPLALEVNKDGHIEREKRMKNRRMLLAIVGLINPIREEP